MRPKMLAVEGADFTGKSTLIKNLSGYLTSRNIPHVTARMPGQTEVGKKIRELVLGEDGKPMKLDPVTLQILFAADKSDFWRNWVPSLPPETQIVLCDRSELSAFVYLTAQRLPNAEILIDTLLRTYSPAGNLWDEIIILSGDTDALYRRAKAGSVVSATDRFESMGLDFQRAIHELYVNNGIDYCRRIGVQDIIYFHDIQTYTDPFTLTTEVIKRSPTLSRL